MKITAYRCLDVVCHSCPSTVLAHEAVPWPRSHFWHLLGCHQSVGFCFTDCGHPPVLPWEIPLTCTFALGQQFKDNCCLMVHAKWIISLGSGLSVWRLRPLLAPHRRPQTDRSTRKREVPTGQGKGHCRLINSVTTRRTLFNFWCQKAQPGLAGKSPWR